MEKVEENEMERKEYKLNYIRRSRRDSLNYEHYSYKKNQTG